MKHSVINGPWYFMRILFGLAALCVAFPVTGMASTSRAAMQVSANVVASSLATAQFKNGHISAYASSTAPYRIHITPVSAHVTNVTFIY